mgnify:CR=1 FL=1
MDEEEDLDGFLDEDGEPLSIREAERLSAVFLVTEKLDVAIEILRHLVLQCVDLGFFDSGYLEAACRYNEKILPLLETPEEKAECLLTTGKLMEELGKYLEAEETYMRAFDFPQQQNETWYYLYNNRAYCLNRMGRPREAEACCRAAIEMQPELHDAYRNLGIALAHLGRHGEAARNFIQATTMCPDDCHALGLLNALFAGHREIVREMPDFPAQLLYCHELVGRQQGDISVQ